MKLNPFAVMKEQFDGTGVVFDPDSNRAMALNATGVVLWHLLQECDSEAELKAALQKRYPDVPAEQLTADLAEFIGELRRRSLLSED